MTQSFTLKSALAVIVAVNLWGALPKFHYGAFAPLKPDEVHVFTADKSSSSPPTPDSTVPIKTFDFRDTGQTVGVYIRSDYRDSEALIYPRITLAIGGIAAIVLLSSRRNSPRI